MILTVMIDITSFSYIFKKTFFLFIIIHFLDGVLVVVVIVVVSLEIVLTGVGVGCSLSYSKSSKCFLASSTWASKSYSS